MITLSSDFGSPYPAAMKGVLLAETDARLVDVSHDFPRQDVRTAAFWLREILPCFPAAVHLVVVDPGVGTDRAALVICAGDHAFVCPDNGVCVPVARTVAGCPATLDSADSDDPAIEVFEIHVDEPDSATFHGRDVFAPAAAAVHEAGVPTLERLELLTPTDSFVELAFPDPRIDAERVLGEVLVVDGFGNAITNVPGEVLDDRFGAWIRANGERVRVARSYAMVDPGEPLVTVGSHGNVELAVNRGRGDEAFGVGIGDDVRLSLVG